MIRARRSARLFAMASLVLPLWVQSQTGFPTLGDSGSIDHADLLITYDAEAMPPLALMIEDHENELIYGSNEVVLVATEACQFTLEGFAVAELGLTNGQTFWWFRQTGPVSGTLFPGFGAEGIPEGLFSDPLSLFVTNVVGPGSLMLWQDFPGGGIAVKVDSRDGFDANDVIPVLGTGHDHCNWAFTAPGVYCVTFRVDGVLSGGDGTVSSLETTVVFHVRPLGVVTPFALWQKAHWLQGTSAFTNGPWADPENDGLCNAIEYSSQLDPNAVTTTNRPVFSFIADGPSLHGAWTFQRIKSAPDVSYFPGAGETLNSVAWQPMTNLVGGVDEGALEIVTLRDHLNVVGVPARFFGYGVQLQP